jgi:hypothetical protein
LSPTCDKRQRLLFVSAEPAKEGAAATTALVIDPAVWSGTLSAWWRRTA